jgi:hypothetical protein
MLTLALQDAEEKMFVVIQERQHRDLQSLVFGDSLLLKDG